MGKAEVFVAGLLLFIVGSVVADIVWHVVKFAAYWRIAFGH